MSSHSLTDQNAAERARMNREFVESIDAGFEASEHVAITLMSFAYVHLVELAAGLLLCLGALGAFALTGLL